MGFVKHKNLPYSEFQLLFPILCSFFIFAVAFDTIRANESMSDSEVLISTGNRFKLSFFSPPNSSHRYVGIMFNLPVMTVVWVANRNKPLYDSFGTFQISSDGNLVILDGQKEVVWSTNLSTNSVGNLSAVLLDTGNLVLQDHDSDNLSVWESFLHASDSWLEKMSIYTDLNKHEKNTLTSWASPDDPAPGRFTLTVEPSVISQVFIWKDGNIPTSRSGPFVRRSYDYGTFAREDSPGMAKISFTISNSSLLAYYHLNSSGNVEERVWSDEKKEWNVRWCRIISECDTYGMCGPFGSCNAEERPICSCLPGFTPTSKQQWMAGNWSSGCTRNTTLKCGEVEFVKMENVKLPDDYQWDTSSEEKCRGACIINCSCIAYAFSLGTGCLQWTRNLTDVQKLTFGDALYVRVVPNSSHADVGSNTSHSHPRAIIVIIVCSLVLGLTIIAIICSCYFPKLLLNYRARKHKERLIFSSTKGTDAGSSQELQIFQFQTLSNATQNFYPINMLGQGGFGLVYKGKLPNGEDIAVKRLARSSNQGVEEFMNEVDLISRLQHRNLVRLIGCCVEHDEKLLVYEYMLNGSLDAYLFNSHKHQFVDWKTCKFIIEGICRGLVYLHRDSRLKIIHRDLKASNILLDEELNPKISDFGMARIFCGKDHQANTSRVVGTFGYMSPEYALHGIFSEKSDVYSFGVILLEILSGRKNSSFYDEEQQLFLLPYAWKLWNEGKIVNLRDPAIYDGGMEDDIVRYANVGLLCVQEVAGNRPNISTVMSMLSCEIAELPPPKQPAFLEMQMCLDTQSSANSSTIYSVNNVTLSTPQGR